MPMRSFYFIVFSFFILLVSCNRVQSPGSATSKKFKADSIEISRLTARNYDYYNNIDSLSAIANKLDRFGKLYNNKKLFFYADLYRANYYYQSGDYVTAMNMSLKALDEAEKLNIKERLPEMYALIGNLHKENLNYPMALQDAATGLNFAVANKDTAAIIALKGLQAMFTNGYSSHRTDKNLKFQAFQLQLEALKIAESSPKYENLRIRFYDNIASYYLDVNQFNKAIDYGNKGVLLSLKYNAQKSLTYSYDWIGMSYYHLNQKQKGIGYLNKALLITKQIKEPFRTMEIYESIYRCYLLSGDYKNAFNYYSLRNRLNDSLKLVNNVRQLGELQIKYQAAKKDNQINYLTSEGQVESRKIIWVFAGLILATILLALIFIQYLTISKKNKLMAITNKTINEQAEKLQFLIKELHHRVKNNLQIVSSLLSLQSSRLVDEDSRNAIKLGQQRIEAMSLIHRSLYQQENPTLVNMKEYITDLTESIMMSFGVAKTDFDLHLDIIVSDLDVDVAMPLGLIINEWVTNAFKHAYGAHQLQPALWIKLSADNNLELEIKDNGLGMPAEMWDKPQKSFGIKLVKVLTRQLRGTCTVENRGGTVLTLHVPRTEIKNLLSA